MANVKWYGDKLIKTVEQKTRDALIKGGFLIETDAKREVRVRTGRLMGSISTNWTGSGRSRGEVQSPAKPEDGVGQPGGSTKEFVVVVGTNVEYAIPQEYGTSKMSAHPYLRPALEKNKGKIKQLLGGK